MTQPTVAPPTATPEVGLTADGRIRGIDGMLDQVAGAAMRQARVELWPAWQADTAMQRTVGEAVGRGAASALAPWVALGATSLAVGAAALVFRAWRGATVRDNPSRQSQHHPQHQPTRKSSSARRRRR